MRRTVQLPPVFGPCTLAADSINRERRTVEAVFLSGQPIARTPLFDDSYWLEFDVTAKAADLSRLNSGAAVLDSHNSYGGVAAVLGRVERAWIEGGKARAELRFSKREDVAPIWQDVLDGILGSVSMGVFLNDVQELEKQKGSDMRRFRVTSWTPYEISLVGVPADAGARIEASADTERRPCRLHLLGGENMRSKKCPACKAKLNHESDTELVECPECHADLEEAERERDELVRVGEAHRIAAFYGGGDVWAQAQIKSGATRQEMLQLASEERAKRAPHISGHGPWLEDYDGPGRLPSMVEGLAARARGVAPEERGRRYHDATLAEIALECLSWRGHGQGLDVRRHASQIVREALGHTTSDFPLLLGNVLNKLLLPSYENAQPTFRAIAARREFRDFRPQRFLRAGDFPIPLQVGEHGEIKQGTMGESEEQVTLLTFGRIFAISRQALVNDDLAAFEMLATSAANRVSDFHNSVFFQTCILPASGLGPNLADGVAVYNAAHGNIAATGALDVTRLGDARAKMMNQTSLDGLKLNLQPLYLLVSPASLTLAEQLVATLSPQQASNVNPFAGKLTALGDANLTGTRFYALADPGRLPQYVYGNLQGEGPLRFEVRAGFEVEGIQAKVATDFACGAIESRAGITGAGA